MIRVLVEGANFSDPKHTGWEKVCKAAKGHSSVVKLLLEKKASVSIKAEGSELTALHMAARNGNEAAVKLLLELGADISGRDGYERTALHLAVEMGHRDTV